MRTAEFVSPKHPDKMCDQISDGILDYFLEGDENSRVAVETMGGHGKIYIAGEVTSKRDIVPIDIYKIISEVVEKDMNVEINIVKQSQEIAQGVDIGGAGDQGIMKGYAVAETMTLMPLEYELARSLCWHIYEKFPNDGKTQITTGDNHEVIAIVASFQNASKSDLKSIIKRWIVTQGIKVSSLCDIYTNPAGDWSIGGFDSDTGLTGRKLLIDNYGPRYAIGGGAFSGKDATKVDRSAAYMARRIAVDLLNRNLDLGEVSVELAYAIGVAKPVEFSVTGENGKKLESADSEFLKQYDLSPKGIIEYLGLRKPQFQETAEWGHFGKGFTWK